MCSFLFLGALMIYLAAAQDTELLRVLQNAAQQASTQFNCSINIAFKSSQHILAVTSGVTGPENRKTRVNDRFVWGSVTKTLTGSSILRMVDQGLISLDDPISKHVDPFLKKLSKNPDDAKYMNYSTVEDLWGPDVSGTTIRMLGKMQAGIPDFDTAKGRDGDLEDPFRATLYANPSHNYGPLEILSFPWVYTKKLQPVSHHAYSSTNFMLLGLILASKSGAESWTDFDQASPLPQSLQEQLKNVVFGNKGKPSDYTAVNGLDRTTYNGKAADDAIDVSDVDGVFAGWTASDLVASVEDVAELTHAIYGSYRVASKASVENIMVPNATESFYGFGTFNLTERTGVAKPFGIAYGHLGATYGFQSITAHFPYYNFTLAVASNIETDHQSQPAAGLCFAFNSARAVLEGRTPPKCTYKDTGYYSGGCSCQ